MKKLQKINFNDIEKIKNLFNDKGYELLESKIKSSKDMIRYKCLKHPDKILKIRWNNFQQGQGCPYCSKRVKPTILELKQKFKNRGLELLENKYINNLKKMNFKCLKHPDKKLSVSYANFQKGKDCKYCGWKRSRLKQNLDINFIRLEFKKRGYELLEEEYINVETKMKYKCLKHSDKNIMIDYVHFKRGQGCPYCNTSKGEFIISNFLSNNKIVYEIEKKFDKCKNINYLRFDFYLPDYNICIEYDGEFHFKKTKLKNNILHQTLRDQIKNKYCIDNNIKLIRIPYWEFDNIDKILKEKILMEENKMNQIIIKYFDKGAPKLKKIDKGDWIDLYNVEDVVLSAGEFKLINLGVAMKVPNGYEAHIAPRGSTFKNFGILQTNSVGVVDESYCGPNDCWFMPVYATKDVSIPKYSRICQFRIIEKMKNIFFFEVSEMGGEDRGGHGSTGVKA